MPNDIASVADQDKQAMAKRAQTIWFFRWTRPAGEQIQQFKIGVLKQSSKKAFWVFDLRKPYRPQRKLAKGRLLVAFDFGARGVSILENESLYVTFPKPEFLGETRHPNQIIVKENEEGAYGIGHLLLRTFPVNAIRLATRGEIADALSIEQRLLKNVLPQHWPN